MSIKDLSRDERKAIVREICCLGAVAPDEMSQYRSELEKTDTKDIEFYINRIEETLDALIDARLI